jgi:hypothetical protein
MSVCIRKHMSCRFKSFACLYAVNPECVSRPILKFESPDFRLETGGRRLKPVPRTCALFVTLILAFANLQLSAQTVSATAGTPPKNWRIERGKLDAEYDQKLKELAQWCEKNRQPVSTIDRFRRTVHRDPLRQFVFVPAENGGQSPGANNSSLELDKKLAEINHWQAERILDLAKQAAADDSGGAAIRLLNEVLYFNLDHAAVRKLLNHKLTDEGWLHYPDRLVIKRATRLHEICRWPAKSYLVATTANFQIESNASEQQVRALAEKLERWHYVWRQLYFDFWANPKLVRRWIAEDGSYSFTKRKFRVVFFPNRQNYLSVLAPLVPGVEISNGYYSNPKNISFFYDSEEPSCEATWKHELTHQLFRESIGSAENLKVFEDECVWLDEGAATYAESLVDFGDYVTLGGFESRRLQFARIGLLLEGYKVPLSQVNQLGRLALQKRPDIVKLYGQIAGQYTMLMNDQAGANEANLISVLHSMYRGRPIKPAKLEAKFGASFDELDNRFRDFLIVDAQQVVNHFSAPLLRTELSFAQSQLNADCFNVFGQCHNLIWLDVSGNQIGPQQIEAIKSCESLQQLILTQCRLEPGALRALSGLPQMIELDFSGSSVTDQQLLELQGQTHLKKIILKSTHITPAGIAKLKQLLPQVELVQ